MRPQDIRGYEVRKRVTPETLFPFNEYFGQETLPARVGSGTLHRLAELWIPADRSGRCVHTHAIPTKAEGCPAFLRNFRRDIILIEVGGVMSQ
jgi:hypothetical protein